MDFIKKHYEKVTLGAVLLGLVGALVFLPVLISSDQQRLRDMTDIVANPRPTPLPELDLTEQNNALHRVQTAPYFDFESTNKLFNPVEWQRKPDGTLIKGTKVGPEVCVVTNITPLYLEMTLESVETNELGARYVLTVERQAAMTRAQQQKVRRYVSLDDRKKDLFTLIDVKGAPENPDQLTLKLADTGELVMISKNKPFRRVDGYSADLRYDPEKKFFPNRRVGSLVSFGGEDYIVVAIEQDLVILSAQSNQKRTTLRYTP